MALSKDGDVLSDVIKAVDEDLAEHENRVAEYDRRYKGYRALRDLRKEQQEAARDSRKPLPAYVFQSIETMASNLVDAHPKWRLHVHPQMATTDPERLQMLLDGARANEILLKHQLSLDHWAEKQRPFDLQGLICGITASKQSWSYREGVKRSLQHFSLPQLNLWGEQVGEVSGYRENEDKHTYRDDPTSEIVDVRHLIFQRGATSLQNSERITHRVFKSFAALERNKCKVNAGKPHSDMDRCPHYHDLDKIEEEREKGISATHFTREQELYGERPHRDDIELLEYWCREGDQLRCVTVANRKVVIQNRLSPFWFDHLDHPFPFVVCSGTPDLFKVNGISEVEMMAELQEMLWMLIHQRLTNLELVNNAIMLIADDVIDPDEFEPEPGARFLVPRPVQETVQWWAPDVRVADLSMQAEALLKGDLQNVTGGMPFLSGTDTSTIDQETATGVSIVTSLAQKRLAAKRQQFIWAKSRIGEQWCALNQQFIREDRLVPVIGEDGVEAFEEIRPELLQGQYLFETEMAEESLMRQEKRAEAQALFQVAIQAAGPMAMMGTPINAKAFMDDVLEAYGVQDKDRYYSAQPQVPAGMEQPTPAQPGMEAATGGVTNPGLAAGPTSPSNQTSLSGEAAMQQFMANRGQVN